MKYIKFVIILLTTAFLLNFISCTTTSNTEKENTIASDYNKLFDTYRKYNGSVCMGISGPYVNRQKAYEVATANCLQMLAYAEQLAIQIDYGTIVDEKAKKDLFDSFQISGTSDYYFNKAASEMEIVEAVWIGGNVGAAVFAKIPSLENVKWNSSTNWLNDDVVIEGFNVASAASRKTYSNFVKALDEAAFRAAGALLDVDASAINVSNHIAEVKTDIYSADSYSIAGDRVSGFVVLDYKYDPATNTVYALAISKKK